MVASISRKKSHLGRKFGSFFICPKKRVDPKFEFFRHDDASNDIETNQDLIVGAGSHIDCVLLAYELI